MTMTDYRKQLASHYCFNRYEQTEKENIELICSKCDAWIKEDDYCHLPNKLEGLREVLSKVLEIPSNRSFRIDDDGNIPFQLTGSSLTHPTILDNT